MENKKTLNVILMILSVAIILTFSLFYKSIASITADDSFFKILYFATLYLSIIITGVGVIISFICAFKDNYNLIWFVEFLNACSFFIMILATLSFAISNSININFAYFMIIIEYFALNITNSMVRICSNFKFIKSDFIDLFTNSSENKSSRYGLEEAKTNDEPKNSKSKKYNLEPEEAEENKSENFNENEQIPEDKTKEVLIINQANQENSQETEINNDLNNVTTQEVEISEINQNEVFETSKNLETQNSLKDDEISKEEAQDLSDTITNVNDEDLTEEEIQQEEKLEEEIQEEVERLIEKSKEEESEEESEKSLVEPEVFEDDEIKIKNVDKHQELNISDDDIVVSMEDSIEEKGEDIDENHMPLDEFLKEEEILNTEGQDANITENIAETQEISENKEEQHELTEEEKIALDKEEKLNRLKNLISKK